MFLTGDMGKATPRFLFRQHPDQEIKGPEAAV
jgi:hypothetical protein